MVADRGEQLGLLERVAPALVHHRLVVARRQLRHDPPAVAALGQLRVVVLRPDHVGAGRPGAAVATTSRCTSTTSSAVLGRSVSVVMVRQPPAAVTRHSPGTLDRGYGKTG
ncbi:hypothetical protein [Catenuloplanes atrovinosus]|uniref:Uncharacterized protein n=1 Tax=Catenuloplanes atrovinosus TaxID=137266 RepID=A0AAE3YME5_9ACTN|nr:hypothetical protein [Catenuloplanes atrovinosus]MDR7276200.1 hypothetical protein [Catenuloplanes atrovinosus]